MKVGISCDPASAQLKQYLMDMVKGEHPLVDCGVHEVPWLMVRQAASDVKERKVHAMVFLTDLGVTPAIFANKVQGLRCVAASTEQHVEAARRSVDANALSLSSQDLKGFAAIAILKKFLKADSSQQAKEVGTDLEKMCKEDQRMKAAVAKFSTQIAGGSLASKLGAKLGALGQTQQPDAAVPLAKFDQGYTEDQAARSIINKVKGEQASGERALQPELSLQQKLAGALGSTQMKTAQELDVAQYVQQPAQQSLADRLAGKLAQQPSAVPVQPKLVSPEKPKPQEAPPAVPEPPALDFGPAPAFVLPFDLPAPAPAPMAPQMSLQQKLMAQSKAAEQAAPPKPAPKQSIQVEMGVYLRPASDAPTKFDITAYKGFLRDNEDDIRALMKEIATLKAALTPELLCDAYNQFHGEKIHVDAFRTDPVAIVRKHFSMKMRERLCAACGFRSALGATTAEVLGALTCQEEIGKTFKPTDQDWLQKLYSAVQ